MVDVRESDLLNDFQNLQVCTEVWAENAPLEKIRQKLSTHPELKSSEQKGYCKWFGDAEKSFTFDGAIEQLRSLNLSDILSTLTDQTREFLFTDLFCLQLNISFLNVLLGKEEEAHKNFDEASQSLNYLRTIVLTQPQKDIAHKDEEHFQGAEFVLSSLKLLLKLQFEDDESFKTAFQNFAKYDSLSPKSKAFVLITESKFLTTFPCSTSKKLVHEATRVSISKTLELDITHWEWYLENFQLLRCDRLNKGDWADKQCSKETYFIETAYKLNPNHPLCILRSCQYLVEYVQCGSYNRDGEGLFPLEFGTKIFFKMQDIVDFLKEQAEQFLEKHYLPKWLSQFAKFFSNNLPHSPVDYRDRKLAKKCLQKALSISPQSSLANQAMGVFSSQDKFFSKAEFHFKMAVETDIRNATAVIDYLRSLMRNIPENAEDIKCLLSRVIPVYEKTANLKPLLFLKGYFHLQLCERDLAIETWLKWTGIIENTFPWSIGFSNIGKHASHSGWPRIEVEHLQGIREVVVDFRQRIDGPNGPYSDLLKLIDEGIQATATASRSWPRHRKFKF